MSISYVVDTAASFTAAFLMSSAPSEEYRKPGVQDHDANGVPKWTCSVAVDGAREGEAPRPVGCAHGHGDAAERPVQRHHARHARGPGGPGGWCVGPGEARQREHQRRPGLSHCHRHPFGRVVVPLVQEQRERGVMAAPPPDMMRPTLGQQLDARLDHIAHLQDRIATLAAAVAAQSADLADTRQIVAHLQRRVSRFP